MAPHNPGKAPAAPSYTKRPKDYVSAEECVSIVRAHITRAHHATLRRVAIGVVIWTAAILLLHAALHR